MRRLLLPSLLIGALLTGCSTFESGEEQGPPLPPDMARQANGKTATAWPVALGDTEVRKRVARLLPPGVKDKAGWAEDLHTAFKVLEVPHASQTYCAAIAIIEQESSFQAAPVVPGLPNIVRRELETRAGRFAVPSLLVTAALNKNSPTGKTYNERIDALKTETQLNDLFEDMIGELPFGQQLFADYNPVRTGGPMQVSVEFATQHVKERSYPYPIARKLRNEVFTRRGGLYFGSAILLDYEVPYDQIVYRFADFNAGRYSSRNVAFQAAVAQLGGRSLTLDGDLLRYQGGQPSDEPSATFSALLELVPRLGLSPAEIKRDLRLEKSAAFAQTSLYSRVFAAADARAGSRQPREAMPRIDLKSPKIQRKLTTAWFAERVDSRHRTCLGRDRSASP